LTQCRIGLLREWYIRRDRRRIDDRTVIDIRQDTINFVIKYTPQTERVTLWLISMSTAKMRLETVCETALGCSRGKATYGLSESDLCASAREIRTHPEGGQTA
jgi:hypothetical protein